MWKMFGIHRGKVGLFCTNYPTLIDRQVSQIKSTFPRWLGELHETQTDGFVFELYDKWGGGMIMLRNLDDPKKYDSTGDERASQGWCPTVLDTNGDGKITKPWNEPGAQAIDPAKMFQGLASSAGRCDDNNGTDRSVSL